jgi:hypothetical protein
MNTQTLFAVCLGGRAPNCNTELHDVVFVRGDSIESTYQQLLEKWFGTAAGLHLDSWVALDIVDGHRVQLSDQAATTKEKLFFVNLGAYADGKFMELHDNVFLVAANAETAKARAKALLRASLPGHLHTDDLHDVDDCLEVGRVDGRHIILQKTGETRPLNPVNAYHVIPEPLIQDFLARQAARRA